MRTLLLADDNITVQRVIALTFAKEPVRIVTASDGHQAMDRVVVDRPDIVLAGTTLPEVNGYDLSRFVKSKPESKHVPVLLLSGAFESIDEAQLLASGANGVIEKPVEPTVVIRRVKELLGLTTRDAAPAAGRLVTPETVTAGQRPTPTMPRAVTTSRPMPPPAAWDERREQTPDKHARPVEDTTGRNDYLESLGDAFDTLDQQLAGRPPTNQQRNPSPPLGQLHQSGDPRSPGRMPTPQSAATPGNPVYEVDEDWFGDSPSRDQARAGRVDMNEELRDPALQRPPAAAPAQPVYELDDEWFAEDQKARDARQLEQRELAREMGIHEVELPERAAAPLADDDFEFGEADLTAAIVTGPIEPPKVAEPPQVVELPPVVEPSRPIEAPIAATPPRVVEPLKVVEARRVVDAPKIEAPTVVEAPEVVEARQAPEPVTPVVEVALASAVAPANSEEHGPVEPVPVIEMTLSAHRDEEHRTIEPIARTLPIDFFAAAPAERTPAPPLAQDTPVAPPASFPAEMPGVTDAFLTSTTEPRRDTRDVANDFDALLAFEQGTNASPPMIEPIIHAVTPEITAEMIEEIATTVADRLRDNIRAPEITGEIIKTLAFLVSGSLKDQIRVEPVAPQLTGEIIKTLAFLVSGSLKDEIRVEPVAPQLTGEIIETLAYLVSGSLKDHIHVERNARSDLGAGVGSAAAHHQDRSSGPGVDAADARTGGGHGGGPPEKQHSRGAGRAANYAADARPHRVGRV
jgi:CheY-like chemotaxis protein